MRSAIVGGSGSSQGWPWVAAGQLKGPRLQVQRLATGGVWVGRTGVDRPRGATAEGEANLRRSCAGSASAPQSEARCGWPQEGGWPTCLRQVAARVVSGKPLAGAGIVGDRWGRWPGAGLRGAPCPWEGVPAAALAEALTGFAEVELTPVGLERVVAGLRGSALCGCARWARVRRCLGPARWVGAWVWVSGAGVSASRSPAVERTRRTRGLRSCVSSLAMAGPWLGGWREDSGVSCRGPRSRRCVWCQWEGSCGRVSDVLRGTRWVDRCGQGGAPSWCSGERRFT